MTIKDPKAAEINNKRYATAAHAMQSATAFEMNYSDSHTPKHLRVGINSAFVVQRGLAMLLIDKGIITEDEYIKYQADAMELEVLEAEKRAGVKFR